MKKLLFLLPLIITTARAGTILFTWPGPLPADFGGLSTNDYMTNITFRLYSSTSVAAPLSTWTVVTNIPGAPMLTQGPIGTQWSVPITNDVPTRFYAMTAFSTKVGGSGESPFSNTDFLLAALRQGTIAVRSQ